MIIKFVKIDNVIKVEHMKTLAKTRKEIASEYGISYKTLQKWLLNIDVDVPRGLITPKVQKTIYNKLGKPKPTKLLLIFFILFSLSLNGQESNNWNIKTGLSTFAFNSEYFSNDIIWNLILSYRFENFDFGGVYQKTRTIISSENENTILASKVNLDMYSIRSSFYFNKFIKNKKITDIIDLYATSQVGLSFAQETNTSSKVGQHIYFGLGTNIYIAKNIGIYFEYGHQWFSNNNTINLNQKMFFAGLTTRSLFFKYDNTNDNSGLWDIKVGTVLNDSYGRNHGNIRLETGYKITKVLESGIYFGISNIPFEYDDAYSPDFGLSSNFHILPLFLNTSNKFEPYLTGKIGGYYINNKSLYSEKLGLTFSIGAGSSFYLWKQMGFFFEYNYSFSDFSFYKGNIFRSGLTYRFH